MFYLDWFSDWPRWNPQIFRIYCIPWWVYIYQGVLWFQVHYYRLVKSNSFYTGKNSRHVFTQSVHTALLSLERQRVIRWTNLPIFRQGRTEVSVWIRDLLRKHMETLTICKKRQSSQRSIFFGGSLTKACSKGCSWGSRLPGNFYICLRILFGGSWVKERACGPFFGYM